MNHGTTSEKVQTVTSIAVGLKNLHREQDSTVTFTHVDDSKVRFDDKLDVKLEDIGAAYSPGKVFAEGGQGIIREGVDLNLRRLVAIKTLKVQPEDQFTRGQFIQEARVTAQLSHPAIIPIYSLNSDENDGLHLAMKLVDGKTLKSYLEQLDHEYRTSGVDHFDERKSLMYRLEIILRVCERSPDLPVIVSFSHCLLQGLDRLLACLFVACSEANYQNHFVCHSITKICFSLCNTSWRYISWQRYWILPSFLRVRCMEHPSP